MRRLASAAGAGCVSGPLSSRRAEHAHHELIAAGPGALCRGKEGVSMVAATDSATRDDDGRPRWRARWAVFSLGMGDCAPGANRPLAGRSTASVRTGRRDSRGPPMRARRGQGRQGWRGRTPSLRCFATLRRASRSCNRPFRSRFLASYRKAIFERKANAAMSGPRDLLLERVPGAH